MSAQADIRLLVADVDGTLVTDDKVLTVAVMEAVRDLRNAGIGLAITSSRPPRGMRMLVEPLALQEVIAGFNGGMYVKPDFSVIGCHALDARAAEETVNVILDHGLDAWVYTGHDWFVRDRNAPHVAREEWILKFESIETPAFTDEQLGCAVKIVGVSDDPGRIAACTDAAQRNLGGAASAVPSQTYYLDVTHPLANKGVVVETLSKRLAIAPEHIATIGDMPTDVLMFRKSGFSIAMGNASDAVKARARAVTDSNEHDGFAKAVRKYVLPGASA